MTLVSPSQRTRWQHPLLTLPRALREDELPMFVEGVDRDITSDLTTRLMFEPLGRFTESMLRAYPQFKAGNDGVVRCSSRVPT